jgi:hypothetical protein
VRWGEKRFLVRGKDVEQFERFLEFSGGWVWSKRSRREKIAL